MKGRHIVALTVFAWLAGLSYGVYLALSKVSEAQGRTVEGVTQEIERHAARQKRRRPGR